jgi:anaerobic selenocysteine-containing dehydrogenase
VARYAERIHHPDRLLHPLRAPGRRARASSSRSPGTTRSRSRAEKFLDAEREHGPEAVWPYYYAGTMGLVMRDGINRLRHAKKYSGPFDTICVNAGLDRLLAGTGQARRPRSARDGEVRPAS